MFETSENTPFSQTTLPFNPFFTLQTLPSLSTRYNDNPTFQITTQKLNGQNFLQWSQLAKLFIKSKGKMSYTIGAKSKSNSNDRRYELWDEENFMVRSWLLHSMQLEISQTYLFFSIAKEIWDAINQMYSKIGITTQKYELKC